MMTDGWIRADELQDRRLDNLEQRLIILEEALIEIKTVVRTLKGLLIGVAGVLGLNVHQLML
jgi:hypothetical protein